MKATKFTLELRTETLSVDAIPTLLVKASQEIRAEVLGAFINMDDGDQVAWSVIKKEVEF